jgi:putative ABC transport system permease protein
LERAKETGIRKSSGARKGQLVFQFLFESILLNILAVILAFCLILSVLPMFNSYTGKYLMLGILNMRFYLSMSVFIFLGALFSGLYPAYVLSNYKPVISLKGRVKHSHNKIDIRKSLIVIQFMATISLLIGTFIINKQIKYIQSQPLGVNVDQVIALNGNIFQEAENFNNEFKVLKSEIEKFPFVKTVSTSDTYPGQGYYYMSSFVGIFSPNTTIEDRQTYWNTYRVDEDFASLMNLEVLAGRFFRESDKGKNIIIVNEKASEKMGFEKESYPIGETTKFWGRDWQIAGVMKDYHHFGFKTEIEPMIFRYTPVSGENLLVKLDNQYLSTNGLKTAIQQIENTWNSVFEESTFSYTFVDKQFEAIYKEDQQFNKAFSVFTALAIFISSMGLFGLALFICTQRIKEIGVRKVNGAKITEILALLNKEFVMWIIIAFVIASPLAWYTMNKWLENFAYKTEMSWWIFALAGFIALAIALVTVSFQSWRAASRNPVEALRYE